MRVLIMTDMEGVSGIVVWDQVTGGKPMYEEGRRLYTEEINAAARAEQTHVVPLTVWGCTPKTPLRPWPVREHGRSQLSDLSSVTVRLR